MSQRIEALDALHLVKQLKRKSDAHKGDAGKVLLIGGASTMSGALVLAGQAALYSGAGWVVLMMLDEASAHMVPEQPELMVHDAHNKQPQVALSQIQADVIAIGPGLGQSPLALQWLKAALSSPTPLVIDADAINLLAQHEDVLKALQQRAYPTTLTPHPGEASRLLSCASADVQAHRAKSIRELVERTQAVVVLKGHHSLMASPMHGILQCMQGNPALAVAGSGDVLTGCMSAIVAQGRKHGLDQWQASCLAVQLHAVAADTLVSKGIGPIGMTPSELVIELRQCINAHLN
jgi:ADP-dependent NAD(P)H-hydrate dehydratase / NAD(P)H-hydrate epimerase